MKKKPRITRQYQPKRHVWPWIVALTAALLFMWLGYYSQTVENVDANEFVALKIAEYDMETRERSHRIIQELYHISDDEIAQPVDLFNERGKI